MKKKTSSTTALLILLLLAAAFLALFSLEAPNVSAQSHTWTVDDDGPADFSTIQAAISGARVGDQISVKAGIYHELINLNKTLALVAENKNAIMDGGGLGTIVILQATGCSIQGFTIKNAGGYPESLVRVGANATRIINNTLSNGDKGIELLPWSDWNAIYGNEIIDVGIGVFADSSSYNDISYNNVGTCLGQGIYLYDRSKNNTVASNRVFQCGVAGIMVYGAGDESNNLIVNNVVSGNECGIWIGVSSLKAVVADNFVTLNSQGIYLQGALNTTVIRNRIQRSINVGVYIDGECKNTLFFYNDFNNTRQVENRASAYYLPILWDNEHPVNNYPLGGNFWSDYHGVDANGDNLGDTPYVIDANSQDRHPLITPFNPQQTNIATTASISFQPEPIGFQQNTIISARVWPPPPNSSYVFHSLRLTILLPNNTTETRILTSFTDGSVTLQYMPTQIGAYLLTLEYPGEFFGDANINYQASTSSVYLMYILQEPVPSSSPTPIPTASPTPYQSPSPTPTPTPTASSTPIPSPSPIPTSSPMPSPTVTEPQHSPPTSTPTPTSLSPATSSTPITTPHKSKSPSPNPTYLIQPREVQPTQNPGFPMLAIVIVIGAVLIVGLAGFGLYKLCRKSKR